MRRKTTEEFKKEIFDLVGDSYSVLGEYINSNTKIKMKHNICGCEYEVIPYKFLNGQRCPKCNNNNLKKTTEKFKSEVKELVGDEYSVMSEYQGALIKIKMRHNCDKCNNYEFEVKPTLFLGGSKRCPKCYKVRKERAYNKTTEEFKKEVFDLVGDEYEVLGKYKDSVTKIEMKHKVCGYEYEVRPNNFLGGNRCPKCSGKLREDGTSILEKKTTEEFKNEVRERVGEEYTVLGEYKTAITKIRMRHNCDKCNNYEWDIKPNNFLNGQRCPKCSHKIKKNTETFKEEVRELVGDSYSVMSEYQGSLDKIKIKCNTCNYVMDITPNRFLMGYRCPKCKKRNRKKEGK